MRRRVLTVVALVASAFLVAAGAASADTPFGGDPTGHRLTATLTIIATNAQGESQTVTKSITVKPAKPTKKS